MVLQSYVITVVGKDSHIKRLINEASGCLDCGATDYDVINKLDPLLHMYDIIMELNGTKWSVLHKGDVIMTSKIKLSSLFPIHCYLSR